MAAQLPSGKTASAGGGGAGSDSDGGSDSSESSATAGPVFKNGGSLKQGSREALSAGSLALRHTKEEAEFLKKLVDFMDKRGTPIDRLPMIGVMPGKKAGFCDQTTPYSSQLRICRLFLLCNLGLFFISH